jgi:serine/threonine protein kinase
MSILPGQVLLYRFRVDSYVGSGGMGSVFRVWDTQRNVPLAMKVLREDLAEAPGGLRQLQAEAKALQELAHPNIVPFYGLYQTSGGVFLLEDYVEGASLKEALRKQAGKPESPEETLLYFKPLCAALQYAHNRAIIHCDVKPGNILRDQRDQVYLADFGIARYLGSSARESSPVGTPAYMAPEQIRSDALTPQTDIYALGVVLYEMLTGGQLPFDGARAKVQGSLTDRIQWEHLHKQPVSPRRYNRSISHELERIIMRCLEKEPEKRYPNVLDLLNELSAVLALQPTPSTRLILPDLPTWTVWTGGLLLLATVILFLSFISRKNPGSSPPPTFMAIGDRPSATLKTPASTPSVRASPITPAGNAGTSPISPLTQRPVRATASLSLTLTPSPPSATPSPAPTRSPTPRPDYPVTACMTAQLGSGNQVSECVTNVHLMPEGNLRFDFTWTASLAPEVKEVRIFSAVGNTNIYLVDNLGNRYDFLQAGGDAALDIKLSDQQSAHGWFLFPAPASGATSFIFVDDDNGIRTSPITLKP